MIKFLGLRLRKIAWAKFPLTQVQLMEISWKQITSIYPKFHCLSERLADAAGPLRMESHWWEGFVALNFLLEWYHLWTGWPMRSPELREALSSSSWRVICPIMGSVGSLTKASWGLGKCTIPSVRAMSTQQNCIHFDGKNTSHDSKASIWFPKNYAHRGALTSPLQCSGLDHT